MKYLLLFAAAASSAAAVTIAARTANAMRELRVEAKFRHTGKELLAIMNTESYRTLRTR